MPELPEVETIRRGLVPRLVGSRIRSVDVLAPKLARGNVTDLHGRTIAEVRRHGKLLVFILDNKLAFTVHLKMTGQLLWRGEGKDAVMGGHPSQGYLDPLPHKHTRIVINFEDGSTLFFNDLRMFGHLTVLTEEALNDHVFVNALGPEPLEEKFTVEYLQARLQRKAKVSLKVFLLDQTNIAGLGNIYADESCFRAGILPMRLAGSLSQKEVELLHGAIRETLELALKFGGSSAKDYLNAIGDKGTYLQVANVYHRTGLPCTRCKVGTIERIKLAGRSTHFCPNCQH
ncbi:MAG TPA: bifunctional DNA-formamidopyrimidine glycosylase/DNA-(apurinic or apyrimidinic site) lyase [Verrucomicrobiae bacterium]|nr:bifunctional DNA-formamidopyrimidine glycosylase/DNA-(apurinic or apyrimidinic site) lyase [Verrucomicrobiae bacterium]